MDAAPSGWKFGRAEVSGDFSWPLLVRVYVIKRTKKGRSLGGSRESPLLSFDLPFTGAETWTEQSVLEFVHQHTLRTIQSWIGTLPEFLLLHTFAHCIGAIQVLETESSFCLPILFVLLVDYPMPRYMRGWLVSIALVGIGCT